MNLDNIENLSEEQILELYDETLLISNCEMYFYVECDNDGYTGYCQACGYNCYAPLDNGYTFYNNNTDKYNITWFCCAREGGGRFHSLGGASSFIKCDPYNPYI